MKTLANRLVAVALGAVVLTSNAAAPAVANSTAPSHSDSITINVRDADLQDVVSMIAMESGLNIVLDGTSSQAGQQQTHKVTMRLHNVPLRTALRALEESYGLADAWQNNVLHIGDAQMINREFPAVAADPPGQPASNASIVEQVFHLKNMDPDKAATEVAAVVPPGTIVMADPHGGSVYVKGSPDSINIARNLLATLDVSRLGSTDYMTVPVHVNNMTATDVLAILKTELPLVDGDQYTASNHPNLVMLSGTPDFIATAKAMIGDIDKPGQQVRFDVRVTDITPLNDSKNFGVEWGGVDVTGTQQSATGSVTTLFMNKTLQVNATLNALQTQGKAKILAEPSITTLDNEKATLNIGEQYPITYFNPQTGQNQVQFVNAGVELVITPIIGENGEITCTIDTEYSEIIQFVGPYQYPEIGERHVTNVLRVANDQSIVLAGLFSDISNETVTKIPILGDIPILGEVFKNRQTSHTKDEIVFLITPHLVGPADFKQANGSHANP